MKNAALKKGLVRLRGYDKEKFIRSFCRKFRVQNASRPLPALSAPQTGTAITNLPGPAGLAFPRQGISKEPNPKEESLCEIGQAPSNFKRTEPERRPVRCLRERVWSPFQKTGPQRRTACKAAIRFQAVFPCRIRGVFRNGLIRMKRMITRA